MTRVLRETSSAGRASEALSAPFRDPYKDDAADVVVRLSSMIRLAGQPDATDARWKILVNFLATALGPVLRAGKGARFELRNGTFHLNEAQSPIRMTYADYAALRFLLGELHKVRVGGIEFSGLPDEASLRTFATLFHKQSSSFSPSFRALVEDLQRANVRSVVPLPEGPATGGGSAPRDPRAHGLYVFFKGIASVHDVMEGLRTGNGVGFLHAKRFVQSAVDLLLDDRGLVLALTSIKNYQDYLYNHSVNVCLISLVVGARLGFSRNKLADLGLAALLRDIGKASIPKAILDKQTPLTPEEWQTLRSAPFMAVTGLLRSHGFNDSLLRQVVVAFEHHFKSMKDDRFSPRDFCLYSRIAQLADAFDAMTTPRPYRPKPITPDEALKQIIVDRHVTRADPSLIKTFINAIGLYPVGTVVVLDTNEVAVVAAPPHDQASLARPRVRIIADRFGNEVLDEPICDLTEYDELQNPPRYTRSIATTIDRWNYGINVARHLLSDDPAPQLSFG